MNVSEKERAALVPEYARVVVDAAIGFARTNIAKGKEQGPFAFVASTADRVMLFLDLSPLGPDPGARMLRLMAHGINADLIVFVSEMYMTESTGTKAEALARRAQYKNVSDMPEARDGFWVQLEMHIGIWQAMAPMQAHKGKPRVLPELEFKFSGETMGRFVGCLPKPKTAAH